MGMFKGPKSKNTRATLVRLGAISVASAGCCCGQAFCGDHHNQRGPYLMGAIDNYITHADLADARLVRLMILHRGSADFVQTYIWPRWRNALCRNGTICCPLQTLPVRFRPALRECERLTNDVENIGALLVSTTDFQRAEAGGCRGGYVI
jgi:hypothetical protein